MMVRAAGALSSTPTTLATLVPWCPVLLGPPRDPVYVTIGPRTAVRFTRAPRRAASVWRTTVVAHCCAAHTALHWPLLGTLEVLQYYFCTFGS